MTYAWFDAGNGKRIYRRQREPHTKRSALPCPTIIRDFAEPVQSMADGKYYTSKRGLSASAKAANNPHGQDFIELGNELMPTVQHETSTQQLRDDIRQAKADFDNGWRPEVVTLDP